jgi:hypothetical protein
MKPELRTKALEIFKTYTNTNTFVKRSNENIQISDDGFIWHTINKRYYDPPRDMSWYPSTSLFKELCLCVDNKEILNIIFVFLAEFETEDVKKRREHIKWMVEECGVDIHYGYDMAMYCACRKGNIYAMANLFELGCQIRPSYFVMAVLLSNINMAHWIYWTNRAVIDEYIHTEGVYLLALCHINNKEMKKWLVSNVIDKKRVNSLLFEISPNFWIDN